MKRKKRLKIMIIVAWFVIMGGVVVSGCQYFTQKQATLAAEIDVLQAQQVQLEAEIAKQEAKITEYQTILEGGGE